MYKVLKIMLRGLDQIVTTVMEDLVWGKKARKGARMSRNVLKATAVPKAHKARSTHPTRVVVHVYSGANVQLLK